MANAANHYVILDTEVEDGADPGLISEAGDSSTEGDGSFEEHVVEGEDTALHTEETSNPILPVGSELIWGAACFVILWALMKFVLLKPVLKIMDDRDEKVRVDLETSVGAKAEVSGVLDNYQSSLATTRAEANRIVEDGRAQGEARRRELLAEAEAEAGAIRAAAAEEIAIAKAAALAELRGDVAAIATEAAGTVVGRSLDVAAQRPVVDEYLSRSS